jgi:hypothetical protein
LPCESNDLTRLDIDLEDVRTGTRRIARTLDVQLLSPLIMKLGVVDSKAIIGDNRIDDRTIPSFDKDLFRAVWMQQHQSYSRANADGVKDLWHAHTSIVVKRVADDYRRCRS